MARLFQPGDGLGGYRIARLLGAGGFAEVYEAVDPAGERRALKVLSAEATRGDKVRAGLAREAEALARIEHRNVVQLYEACIEEDLVYLVLEMVEGATLGEKLRDPFTVATLEDVVEWIQQACEGVAEAHAVDVIHRDLKPANILVTPSGVVKVIDFGIAALRSWSASSPMHVAGTALYMAPEMLHGQPSHAGVDVYAMGVILYEALSGTHPLELAGDAATVFAVFEQHLLGEPRPLRDLAPDVPVYLAELVHAALAKDPERRVPSMRALADGLRDALAAMLADPVAPARRASIPCPSLWPGASPLAVTGAVPRERSAFPPPPPRRGVPSLPPSARPLPRPTPTFPPLAPLPLALTVASRPPDPPPRPSVPRPSSSVPVVAEAAGSVAARRRVLPVVAALLAALAAGGLYYGTHTHHGPGVPGTAGGEGSVRRPAASSPALPDGGPPPAVTSSASAATAR